MTTGLTETKKPQLFESDLPEELLKHYLSKKCIAVDTETRGLIIPRDRLCLVQICDENGIVSLVRFQNKIEPSLTKNSNLKQLLEAKNVLKLFHYARFDVAVLKHYLNAQVSPIWCTKIASKLVRTYTERHSLKELSRELLALEMDKTSQTSDWAKDALSDSQLEYAANDVRVLVPLYTQLKALLIREDRLELAERLFNTIPLIAEVDLNGFKDIFEH